LALRPGRVVSIDGALLGPDEARVSVYDRGFLYGDAVFEVLRTYDGKPFALDEHLARLRGSSTRVALTWPFGEDVLRGEIDRAIAAAGNDESYVRIVVTRGSGPLSLDPDTAQDPLRVVFVEPLAAPPRTAYAAGIAVVTVRARRAVDDTAAEGAKVTNYLANLLALREAKGRGAQEAVVVDDRDDVVEGASSNVFVVREGRVVTPPESAGILAGITRRHLLEVARRSGAPVDEAPIARAELHDASEVFITSSIRELLPVVRVDDRPVGSGAPGPVARALHRAFRERAGVGDRPMPWE
jgi:branched-chain amino acid aminotransferase